MIISLYSFRHCEQLNTS